MYERAEKLQDRTGQDRTGQNCHLNLTFQVTFDWQLSQFLRCLFIFTPSIIPLDFEKSQ